MGIGIFDSAQGTAADPDTDYSLEIDIASGATVNGNFDLDGESPFLESSQITVTDETGNGGELTFFINSGVWSFVSDGTAEIGDVFTFTVTGPDEIIAGFGTLPGDSDTVTITFTCFAAGTPIDTPTGRSLIEELTPGVDVLTKDHGTQTLRWIGSRELPSPGDQGAIVIAAGTLGNTSELRVSPAHRILLSGWRAKALTGFDEVLVAARDLVNGDTIWQDRHTPVTYYHMLFDTHQIVLSDGVASESYHPSDTGLTDLSLATRAEVLALFPELAADPAAYGPAARPVVTADVAANLLH